MNKILPPPGPRHRPVHTQQRGISMLIVVALVLAMGLMTLIAFHLSHGQYQLVGNIQHLQQALAQAEATAATAEQWLEDGVNAQSGAFATYDASMMGLYPVGQLAALQRNPTTMEWNDSNSIPTPDGRYLLEQLARGIVTPGSSMQVGQNSTGNCTKVDLFRVVADSKSNVGASRTVETVYATDGCY